VRELQAAVTEEAEALLALLATEPTTIAGVAAALDYAGYCPGAAEPGLVCRESSSMS
jgi:hypothetical protein